MISEENKETLLNVTSQNYLFIKKTLEISLENRQNNTVNGCKLT